MHIELEWLPPFQGAEEVGRTSAAVQMRFGAEIATRFEDEFSRVRSARCASLCIPVRGLAGTILRGDFVGSRFLLVSGSCRMRFRRMRAGA